MTRGLVRLAAAGVMLATVAFGGSAAASTPPSPTPAPTPAPTLTTEPSISVATQKFPDDAVAKGATFKVQGTGWPVNILIELEVCGSEARSGSADCSLGTAQVVASNDHGTFEARLAMVLPPTPCPCVIRAVSQSSTDSATTPVVIPGAPNAHAGDGTVVAPALRRVDVQHVTLVGSDSFSTWMGARARRTLQFEVVNTGTVAVDNATIAFVAGPKGNPTGFIPPVKLARLAVGERRKLTVPIEFSALAFGAQSVRGTVKGTSAPVNFIATTSTHPWLLIVVPIVIAAQLLLLGIRNLLRRRLHRAELAAAAALPVEIDDGPADDALICVVELVEPDPDADPAGEQPALRHQTLVLRSIASVQQLVSDTLHIDEPAAPADDAGNDDEGDEDVEDDEVDEGAEAVPLALHRAMDMRIINTITVLADADLKVGAAYHACDVLCAWIEATYASSEHPAARSLTLRRHVGTSASSGPPAGPGLGMVPLSVLVRTPQVRALV